MRTLCPFDRTALSTFLALALAGCGSGDDNVTGLSGGWSSGSSGSGPTGGSGGSGPTGGGSSGGGDSDDGGSDGTAATETGSGDGDGDGDGDSTSGGTPRFDVGNDTDLSTGGNGGEAGETENCQALDLLFIVDISGSMSEEKANLAANFPNFVQVLDEYVSDPDRGILGYRLGVTNSSWREDGSSTGLDGAFEDRGIDGTPCGTVGLPWLEGPAPDLADNFTCLAQNPRGCTNSCTDQGRERPLDTIGGFIAKSGLNGENQGFYRGDKSLLVIVTLTDEDDHSEPTTPAATKAALDAFTGGDQRYVVVTISGPADTDCNSAFGDADATPRLSEFTELVPNGYWGNICLGDLSQPLADALELIKFSCDNFPPIG